MEKSRTRSLKIKSRITNGSGVPGELNRELRAPGSPAEVRLQQRQVRRAEAVLGRGQLVPVRVDELGQADLVQRGALVGGQLEAAAPRLALSCSSVRAPMIIEVTVGWPSS